MSALALLEAQLVELEAAQRGWVSLAERLTRLSAKLEVTRTKGIELITETEDLYAHIMQLAESGAEIDELFTQLYKSVCHFLGRELHYYREAAKLPEVQGGLRKHFTEGLLAIIERYVELVRTMLVVRPDLAAVTPADIRPTVFTLRIRPLAYLQAMANLFWSAVRHPLSETTIDLSTGRVLYRT